MRKLTVFNFISLNGMYKGADGDISWHRHGEEEGEYSAQSLQADNILLFGRITYEMMASWWPTPMAAEAWPEVARQMNRADKIVFSNTLEAPRWENTIAMDGDIVARIREMKQQPGKDLTILGSGTIVSQFAEAGLIDEYQNHARPCGALQRYAHLQPHEAGHSAEACGGTPGVQKRDDITDV